MQVLINAGPDKVFWKCFMECIVHKRNGGSIVMCITEQFQFYAPVIMVYAITSCRNVDMEWLIIQTDHLNSCGFWTSKAKAQIMQHYLYNDPLREKCVI